MSVKHLLVFCFHLGLALDWAGIAGLIKCHAAGGVPDGSTVVATVTGHGLKDPGVAVENSLAESTVVDADLDSVLAAIGID